MLKLLRNVRKAIKQWQALPSTERDQHKDRVVRIRSLVAELGGKRAVDYVDGSHDDIGDESAVATRPRTEVIADLQIETTSLLTALAAPAAVLAKDSVPRSVRLGGKITSKGLRSVARRYGNR
jgi:hypothetical protein